MFGLRLAQRPWAHYIINSIYGPSRDARPWAYERTRMASQNIVELTDANFENEVLKSELPTLVDFWAVWCGPCRQIAPMVDALADEYKGRAKIAKMDIDNHQIAAQTYQVRNIPTLLIFKGGNVVGQVVGVVPKSKLEAELAKHL